MDYSEKFIHVYLKRSINFKQIKIYTALKIIYVGFVVMSEISLGQLICGKIPPSFELQAAP